MHGKVFATLFGLCLKAAACDVELAYINQASPPFLTDAAPDQALPGLAVEIVKTAAANVGCTVHFLRRPGKRVLAEVSMGLHSGALMYSYSDERAASLVFPTQDGKLDPNRRLARLNYFIYKHQGNKLDWDGQQFHHIDGAIGVNLGYAVAGSLRALGVKIEEVPSTLQNLDKLRMQRLAGYAMYDLAVDKLLRTGHYNSIEKLPTPFSARDYYLAFTKKYYAEHHDEAERLWSAIATVRDKLTAERQQAYPE